MASEKVTQQTEFDAAHRRDLDEILTRPLTPETINDYASTALDDVIVLIGRVLEEYEAQPILVGSTQSERENSALRYYHLGDIETILDHLADVSEQIRSIDDVIASAEYADEVITPPDFGGEVVVGQRGRAFETKQSIPRLKTLLFILSNEFNLDITREEDVRITGGALNSGMIRKLSYYTVEVPSLNRTVLVCDEEQNVTFVLDNEALDRYGITNSLRKMPQSDDASYTLSNLYQIYSTR